MKKETTVEIIKTTLSFAVGAGIDILCFGGTKMILKHVGGNKISKACAYIASFFVGGMATKKAEEYVDNCVEEYAKGYEIIHDGIERRRALKAADDETEKKPAEENEENVEDDGACDIPVIKDYRRPLSDF